jgi:hypothetical protein
MLEQAIEKLRELPEREQEMAAAELFGYLAGFSAPKEGTAISNARSAERDEVASDLNRQFEFLNSRGRAHRPREAAPDRTP